MKAVVQRVLKASLSVDGKLVSEIEKGMVVFLGVKSGDDEKELNKLIAKISKLRIFEDENGKMNLAVKDIGGQILLVSQFTLLANCKDGNRPSFIMAEKPERANMLYLQAKELLQSNGIEVKTGIFGADMKIDVLNDGPVTIFLDSEQL